MVSWNGMLQRAIECLRWSATRRLSVWVSLLLAVLLTGCDSPFTSEPSALLMNLPRLPRVTAEQRLFRNLSLDFLGEYVLPKQEFEKTTVGGLSALTYDSQRDRFYVLSDDRSDLAPARFYTLKLTLETADVRKPQIQSVEIEKVTTLQDKDGKPFVRGTIDPEGIALSPLRSLLISSEGVARSGIPPFLREFELATGRYRRDIPIPDRYLPKTGEDGVQTQGVSDNLGFESLTLNPGTFNAEPFRIFTAIEAPLVQDVPDEPGGLRLRMLHYLAEEGRSLLVSEQMYPMEAPPLGTIQGLTELLAIDQGGHFLALERTYSPEKGFEVKLFQLATGGATDTSQIASLKGELRGVQPIQKQLLQDLSLLGIPIDNLEGISFGPRLPDGSRSLILLSDDNFSPKQKTQFLLFRVNGLT